MKKNKERGAVILESTYCIFAAVLVMMFLLSFGFYLYQKTVVTIVANEVAEEISQTSKLRSVADSSSVSSSDVSGIGKYRYLLFHDKFLEKSRERGRNIADERLSLSALEKEKGGLEVEVEAVTDDIGRRHYEVTVSEKFDYLLGDLLNFLGIHNGDRIEAKVYVSGSDAMNYIQTVKVTKYALKEGAGLSAISKAFSDTISLVKTLLS